MCEQATPKLLHLDGDDEFVIDAVAITAPTGRCRCGCPRVPCGGSAHRERFGALVTLIERVAVGASQADCGCPAELRRLGFDGNITTAQAFRRDSRCGHRRRRLAGHGDRLNSREQAARRSGAGISSPWIRRWWGLHERTSTQQLRGSLQ
jgi:hypothetical protein